MPVLAIPPAVARASPVRSTATGPGPTGLPAIPLLARLPAPPAVAFPERVTRTPGPTIGSPAHTATPTAATAASADATVAIRLASSHQPTANAALSPATVKHVNMITTRRVTRISSPSAHRTE